MENAPVTLTGNAFSGRFNPGYRDNVTAYVINPFVKVGGLEVFGTWEYAFGKNAFENGEGASYASLDNRQTHQTAGELLYRFGKNEKFYVGGRYIKVSSTITDGVTAASPGTRYDVTIDRTSIGGGWFVTRNILLKGEYVSQKYDGYRDVGPNNRFYQGEFSGIVFQGSIAF